MGIDPSITNTGWVVYGPSGIVDRGVFRTQPRDKSGNPILMISRLRAQKESLLNKLKEYDISIIGAEQAPHKLQFSETLVALTYFIQDMCYNYSMDLVYWTPLTIKTYATAGNNKATKHEMIEKAMEDANIRTKMTEHEADAYFASKLTYKLSQYLSGHLPYSQLSDREKHAIWHEKTITRGPRAGVVEQTGVLARWGELFCPFGANHYLGG